MKTRIVRIGNSRGIRIPKPLLEQCRLPEEVELAVEDNTIVIRPGTKPREGWVEAFERMAEQRDDELLDAEAPVLSVWDEVEWEW
ncbi:MAG: AbrB/MazE/SpoVT family DNA-binding domain-containing protein [Longimicrobiales bacterium]